MVLYNCNKDKGIKRNGVIKMKLNYKKLALDFVASYCSPVTAGKIKRAPAYDLRLLCEIAYTGIRYNPSDTLNNGEKSYISKVVKGIKAGALDNALWIE